MIHRITIIIVDLSVWVIIKEQAFYICLSKMDLTIILAIYGSMPLCAANDHARIYRKLWQRPSTSRRGIQSYLPPFFLKLTNSVSSKLVESIILSGNLRNWMIRYSHCKVNKIFWVFNYFAWWPKIDFGWGHHIFAP